MIKSHIIVDFYKADADILATVSLLQIAIEQALAGLGLSIKENTYYQFEPEGVTATIVAEDMHFNIHTWPEHRSCAIDLYSSRDHSFTTQVARALQESFKASEYDMRTLSRI
jgi:S-adenosylmethionine decarboxylase proenzyme